MIQAQTMRLAGARVTRSARSTEPIDLVIHRGRIAPFGSIPARGPVIDLSGCLLLPGLINSHDHLEFNLFPRLGKGPYANAAEWAKDIYHPERSPVREHLAVPKPVRLLWGGIKNLVSGVTTVAHHNRWEPVFEGRFPVQVMRRFGWAHSLDFSPDVTERFRGTPAHWPFIIHAAEGDDSSAFSEIGKLDAMGILTERTVLVHAVALKSSDVETLRTRRCSIVWCPSSNLFTCGQTLTPPVLDSSLPVALGTDSALTSDGDICDEIQAARSLGWVPMERIFEMVTARAASILRLPVGTGEIAERGPADLVAVADSGQSPSEALMNLRPELVIARGRLRLISERLLARNPHLQLTRRQRLVIPGQGEWFVDADISSAHRDAAAVLGPQFRLAGKRLAL